MLNWDKVNKEAIAKAETVLNKGFNAEAFICLSLAKMNKFDEVPNTYIDEDIVTMKDEFIIYMRSKNLLKENKIKQNEFISSLDNLLRQSQKIMSEILHSCETKEERDKCLECLEKIGKLK